MLESDHQYRPKRSFDPRWPPRGRAGTVVRRTAAAHRVPGLVASFLSSMLQEHERGVGGWQAEWPIIAAVIQSTGVAIDSMAEVAEGLSVDARKMRLNIENTNGVIFAERAMMLLGTKLGRDVAHKILEAAARKSVKEGRSLAAVLAETSEVTMHLGPAELEQLETPEQYLGSAEAFRQALISRSDRDDNDKEQ